MEQARYWMWTKRKPDHLGSHVFGASAVPNSSLYGDSWEEQAFAEDAAGTLGGGCIWPPRSYACSFCRREFKSAQALGGHMNVHRRDRARLKQSPTPHTEQEELLPHNHHQICTFLYNKNSSDHSDQGIVLTSSSSPNRVSSSSPPTKIIDSEEKILLAAPQFFSSIVVNENYPKSSISSQQSWSNFSGLKNGEKGPKKTSKSNDGRANNKEAYAKADLSVSLNLLLCQTHSNASDDAEELFQSCKRRKIHEASIPLLQKSTPSDQRCFSQSDVLWPKLSPNSMDEIDLELRLGDPPKVK
ncbi:hypothetical protein ACH5RR_004897 [Cinchona calisaya]|uniref:C2H2-type domain-containing protein n=1 Tax=Cinchona calisaya TaxID=153742 RepID=A0ABD3AZB4_9GENT